MGVEEVYYPAEHGAADTKAPDYGAVAADGEEVGDLMVQLAGWIFLAREYRHSFSLRSQLSCVAAPLAQVLR